MDNGELLRCCGRRHGSDALRARAEQGRQGRGEDLLAHGQRRWICGEVLAMISTVYIAKNVYGGDGLGRLGDGRVVFVPGAWSGEQVRAEIVEEKRHFVKARLVEVVVLNKR